jgi:hypothetical protein
MSTQYTVKIPCVRVINCLNYINYIVSKNTINLIKDRINRHLGMSTNSGI